MPNVVTFQSPVTEKNVNEKQCEIKRGADALKACLEVMTRQLECLRLELQHQLGEREFTKPVLLPVNSMDHDAYALTEDRG